MLPFKAWSSRLTSLLGLCQMFSTGSMRRGRTGHPDASGLTRFATRFINLLSIRRFAPRELCTCTSIAVACATFFWLADGGDTGSASAHPLTTGRSSRLNRPCGNRPDTPEYLHGRVLLGHLSVTEVEYPNFSDARRSRRLICRQGTDRRPFCGAGGGGKTTPDWSQSRSFSDKTVASPGDEGCGKGRQLPRHPPSETKLWPHPEVKAEIKLWAHVDLQLPRRPDEHGTRPLVREIRVNNATSLSQALEITN